MVPASPVLEHLSAEGRTRHNSATLATVHSSDGMRQDAAAAAATGESLNLLLLIHLNYTD